MSRALHRLRIDSILVRDCSIEARPHLTRVGVDRKVPRVLLIERVDLEVPDQARFAASDRQQHQAPFGRPRRHSDTRESSRPHSLPPRAIRN